MKYAKLAWLGSLGLMIGVVYFQYVRGLQPCELCIYQRVPHIVVLVIGAYAIWARSAWLCLIMAGLMLLGAGIAIFHVGVEAHWWAGLQSCSGEAQLSVEDLLATPPARCDEIAWSFLGLSMAGWNALISTALGALWIMAWKRSHS